MARLANLLSILAIASLAGALAARAWAVPIPFVSAGKVARMALPAPLALGLPPVAGEGNASQPLVVIDAGHGGFDYGARAPGYDEKAITLALATALRDQLVRDGGVRVAMTREDDRFVSLTERFEAARRLGADLFLSIHADSAGADNERADEIAGASIYTLSDRASSTAARRFAQRENASDEVNGQSLAGQSDVVNSILIELAQRRTQAQSQRLAELIEQSGEGLIAFHPDPQRAATLEVLRAPDVPSVLFESGYITNPRDAARLTSDKGRADFARAMGRAIRLFFAAQRVQAEARGETVAAPAGPSSSPIASPAADP